jgi:alanine racemase
MRPPAAAAGGRIPVHVKVDTGMHRVGADPGAAAAIVASVVRSDALRFDGFWTHLAVADDPGDGFTAEQLDRFEQSRRSLALAGLPAPRLLHAANSAGALAHPSSRYDFVRCGIALYGYPPSAAVAAPAGLRRVLSWKARVAMVRDLDAGERTSYGRRYELGRPARVAVVPVGYHDGVPRRLFDAGGEVLIGGRRCPLAGTVTMDQLVVDCGPQPGEPTSAGSDVAPGDEVVLIGEQVGEEITAEDWAARLGTISYEVLCGIGPRVPRRNVASPLAGNGQALSVVRAGRSD